MDWTFLSASTASLDMRMIRRQMADYLRSEDAGSTAIDACATILSELFANVVRYAPGSIAVSLTLVDDEAVLCVSDEGPSYTWRTELPSDLFAESGRGLVLVAAFASAYSVVKSAGGCLTTVTFPLARGSDKKAVNPPRIPHEILTTDTEPNAA